MLHQKEASRKVALAPHHNLSNNNVCLDNDAQVLLNSAQEYKGRSNKYMQSEHKSCKKDQTGTICSACQLSAAGSEDKITQTKKGHANKKKGTRQRPKFPVHRDP